MIQLFLRIADYLRRRSAQLQAIEEYADEQERWRRDPLSHPDIARMAPRELADLPLAIRSAPLEDPAIRPSQATRPWVRDRA